MKTAVIILAVLLLAAGCTDKRIDKVVVNYIGMGVYDSTEFKKPEETRVFENFMRAKVKVQQKFSSVYSLTVRYRDGKTEEFFGNGAFIRNGDTYTVTDEALKKEYSSLVNTGMPGSLQKK